MDPLSSPRRAVPFLAARLLPILPSLALLWAALVPDLRAAETYVKELANNGSVAIVATAAHPTDGTIFVLGRFSGDRLQLGTLPPVTNVDTNGTDFLARLGADGSWRWLGRLTDDSYSGSLTTRAVFVSRNHVFVTGDTIRGLYWVRSDGPASASEGSSAPNGSTSRTPFVTKFDLNGKHAWTAQASNKETLGDTLGAHAFGYDVAADGKGNVFVCGSFRSGVTADASTGTGLNFGSHHAFRARDPSGTSTLWNRLHGKDSNGGADWNHITRDGFVAKLNPDGAWQWVAVAGGVEDAEGGLVSISVNDQSEVYVTGNLQGDPRSDYSYQTALWNAKMTKAVWDSSMSFRGSWGVQADHPADGSVGAWAGKLMGSGSDEGKWFKAIGSNTAGSFILSGSSQARDIVWAGGQAFSVFYHSSSNDVHVARLPGDLSAIEKAAGVVGTSGTNTVSAGTSLTFDRNSNLYLVGLFGAPQAEFTPSTNKLFVTSGQTAFAAKLNSSLEWQWVRQSTQLPGSVPVWGAVPGCVDPETGRLFFGGWFTKGVVSLGPPTSDTLVPPTGEQGATPRSFLAVLLPDGSFLEQVRFEMISAHGGFRVQPPVGAQTVLKGTTVSASVPAVLYEDAAGADVEPTQNAIRDRAVVRHTVTGYELVDTAIAGPSASLSFVITEDTKLRFNWSTEYALDVRNDVTSSGGGLTSTAAGNPEPVVQKHWIPSGEIVTAFIDGIVNSTETTQFGTRYRSTGYLASGATLNSTNAAATFVPWSSVQDRQQVPQFIMQAPAVIEYRWTREHRIQVSTAPSDLINVPVTIGGGVTNTGSGEFWFPDGATVTLSAPELPADPLGYELNGYTSGFGDVSPVNGNGEGLGTGTRRYRVLTLRRGSALTWDYADRIYKGRLTIGGALDFTTGAGATFTGTEASLVDDPADFRSAPLATTIVSGSPPGSTIDDMAVWDDVEDRLFPLRPGVVRFEWARLAGAANPRPLITEVTVAFPATPSFLHVANTPPVALDADTTNSVAFVGLKYSQRSARVSDTAEFTAAEAGWTVLLFSERPDGTAADGDRTRERLRVRTVRTKLWTEGLQSNVPTEIGAPLSSTAHDTTVPHNGYVFFEKARYNPELHHRASRLGPIFPVNREFTPAVEDDLVVVWYRTQEGIHWPYQTVKYSPQWPNTDARIVVASRLGSEGLSRVLVPQPVYARDNFDLVKIYQQPDPSLPGYNPNEEHALIRPSLRFGTDPAPPPAAFALRNNLNLTNQTAAYTSDPYVLVQYHDTLADQSGMRVYRVEIEDSRVPFRRLELTAGTGVVLGTSNVVEFVASAHALRENEVVDLEANRNLDGVASGPHFVRPLSADRFTLSREPGGPPVEATAVVTTNATLQIAVTRLYPYTFDYAMKAGQLVMPPYPLADVIGASPCADTRGANVDSNQRVFWQDHKGQAWAVAGDNDVAADLQMFYSYPLDPTFYHPTLEAGSCLAFIGPTNAQAINYHVTWPAEVPILKAGETLTFSGGEYRQDHPNAPGLPGVLAWAAGQIVYDDANRAMDAARVISFYLGRLAAPLATFRVPFAVSKLPASLQPASGNLNVEGTTWRFKGLDASLQSRVYYDAAAQALAVRGLLDGRTLGDPQLTAAPGSISVLQPNILTARERDTLKALAAGSDWLAAVDALYQLSRDPERVTTAGYGVGLAPVSGQPGRALPAVQFGPGLALLPNAALLDPTGSISEGYVTLAENNDPSLGDAPVTLHIVRVEKKPLFRGAIRTLVPPNPFDEKVTLRHSGDFGANAGDLVFEWRYRPDDGQVVAPPDSAPAGTWTPFADPTGGSGAGLQEINLAGAGAVTLTDNRFFVRWRHSKNDSGWSEWAGAANSRPPGPTEQAKDTYVPQLAEGWVKRVIAAINPFDARISDFRNHDSPATYASMVQQAGAPYRGPVALNADKDVVENTGLIELYTTVLERAKDLSIDLTPAVPNPAVNNTLLLAASRIADLQLLLGNEALTDAEDPTIGFGSDSLEYGALAPTIFCFQNQMGTLLEEELALLRGRSEEGAYPAYNRLLWNFTRAEGEAAYALSYGIRDVNTDGFLNEADARAQYPQGHGDAWGHYLSALRTYYDLLRHPAFNWQPRSENLQLEGVVLAVDYLDERKFAQAAAAKAKAGAEVVNLTYRSRYVEDPDGQWQGYQDTNPSRAWGVNEWARRAGTGALFDWVTANAILPSLDGARTGIQKVDRTTVRELATISAQAVDIRRHLDNANGGLNPIGLASDVVPFDIDPTGLGPDASAPATHFEQVYARAMKALQNALDLFNHANQLSHMLRQTAVSEEQFAQDAQDQDLDYRNRLIEIFGTPYEGTIGPGKAYPAGYSGPDLYLYMYVDVTGIQNVPAPSEQFTAYFQSLPGGFINKQAPGGGGDSIGAVWSHYFDTDVPNVADNTKTDFSDVLELKMPQTASGYSFQAPGEWGLRRAPGQLQQVLSELVQAEADLQLALHDYDGVIGDLGDAAVLIEAQSDLQAEEIRIAEKGVRDTRGFNAGIQIANSTAQALHVSSDLSLNLNDAQIESLPKVAGVAVDPTSTFRGTLKLMGSLATGAMKSVALVSELAAGVLESEKEVAELQRDRDIQKAEFKYAIQEQLKEFEGLLGDEAALRIEVFRRQEVLRQASDKYRAQLESGLRLLEERTLHNQRTAGATQRNRYQDYTFRVARNEALSKYRAAFDLAARYTYLAAKAYDYETNLDPNDSASARPLLTEILRARTLGAIENDEPRVGSGGLADALAMLKVNFDVLKTQMGFNNPQGESGQFSLRSELFRMKTADGTTWRQQLEKHRVADLWQLPEFRRYCRPFAPQSAGAQPGLVIPFSTEVVFGKNLFGWPLGPGDSAYDPTLFATKVRSVGVWFDDYAGEGLGTTPRVYLVPAGLDIMLVPTSAELATREWNVVDQRIPVPLPIGSGALRNPDWIPLKDSLNGTLAEIRRYSSFRAYHNAGFSPDEMSFDSRLVGRSVWNTRWLLIIPGGTFLADQTDGLDTFIYGLKAAGGPATDSRGNKRDGNGITDIKLSFQTYAISGN